MIQKRYVHIPRRSRLLRLKKLGQERPAIGALFLDRDGVLVDEVHYLRKVSQIKLNRSILEFIRSRQDEMLILVVTNQSGIGRGLLTEQELLKIHDNVAKILLQNGVFVDAFYYCSHLPTARIERYRKECACRKPKPGMLFRARSEWGIDLTRSLLIGDSPRDIEAGRAAGVRSCFLEHLEELHRFSDLERSSRFSSLRAEKLRE